jgi:hypothetical protein
MDKLSIILHEERTLFAPCETIRGTIEWNLAENPRGLDLSLFWYTIGKGTRDVGLVESRHFDSPGAYGSKEFSFVLPHGPYSFSGKLISLVWALELTCTPGTETIRREFTLSPTGQEIVLGEAVSANRFPWSQDGAGPNPLERILGVHR